MAAPRTCYCRVCGGKARFINKWRNGSGGRSSRYACLELDCGIRWTVRDDGSHSCNGCRHWLRDRCGLGLPEALLDPDFGATCPARAQQAF